MITWLKERFGDPYQFALLSLLGSSVSWLVFSAPAFATALFVSVVIVLGYLLTAFVSVIRAYGDESGSIVREFLEPLARLEHPLDIAKRSQAAIRRKEDERERARLDENVRRADEELRGVEAEVADAERRLAFLKRLGRELEPLGSGVQDLAGRIFSRRGETAAKEFVALCLETHELVRRTVRALPHDVALHAEARAAIENGDVERMREIETRAVRERRLRDAAAERGVLGDLEPALAARDLDAAARALDEAQKRKERAATVEALVMRLDARKPASYPMNGDRLIADARTAAANGGRAYRLALHALEQAVLK